MSRILIIEDEEAIAELEKDYLELSGFEVIICNRGDLGLNMALKEDFDLIILDLMLPEIDGFEICRQVREAKNTPIIMVSAKKDDIDKIRGLGLGADDYMTKPFSPSELVARVKAHMDRYNRLIGSTTQKNDIIEIRGIKIDKTARRVWVNGEEKTFTTKEFDLLTFLAQNPNRVFTKEELFSRYEIWLENYYKTINIESNTLAEMIQKQVIPSVFTYVEKLADTAAVKKSVVADVSVASEAALISKLSTLADTMTKDLETLKADTAKALAASDDVLACAKAYQETVLEDMDTLRKSADEAEALIPDELLPYPTYDELLFSI